MPTKKQTPIPFWVITISVNLTIILLCSNQNLGIGFNFLFFFTHNICKSTWFYHPYFVSWIPFLLSFCFVPTNPNNFFFLLNLTSKHLTHYLLLFCSTQFILHICYHQWKKLANVTSLLKMATHKPRIVLKYSYVEVLYGRVKHSSQESMYNGKE